MKFFRLLAACATLFVLPTWAADFYIEENAGNARIQVYTSTSDLTLFRLPTPGTSTWPGSACTALAVPGQYVNKFLAVYVQAKATGTKFFMFYDTTTCWVSSFGINGQG